MPLIEERHSMINPFEYIQHQRFQSHHNQGDPSKMRPGLFSIPHPRNLGMSHLLLQLEDTIKQGFTRRRTPRDIDIHGYNPVTTSGHTVTVMIIPATIRTTAHTDHPSRIRHLIVHLSQCWGHFVGEGAGDDHHVGLTRRGTEDYTQTILVVAWG